MSDWVDIDEVPRRSIRKGDTCKVAGERGRWHIIRIQYSESKTKTILEVVHLRTGAGRIVDADRASELHRSPTGQAGPVRTRTTRHS